MDDSVKEFFQLLKTTNEQIITTDYREIDKEEWRSAIKKSNRNSTSSIFSKRCYNIYECALESKIMIDILL